MPFGLRNAAQTFQRFIDEILRELPFCHAYIDDILIASPDLCTHLRHIRTVFERLQHYGVVINLSKCSFGKSEVEFLGHLVTSDGIRPLPSKVEAILNYPRPHTVKQLQRYLGIVNFYRRFIPNASTLQAPLHEIVPRKLHKNSMPSLIWTKTAEQTFDLTKTSLASASQLAHPKRDTPLAVFVDASDVGMGAVL